MTDTALGYLLVAIGILFVLGLVFAISTRDSRAARAAADPPAGVHLPPPSYLPVVMALAAAVLGIGLIFSVWLLIPGFLILAAGALGWFMAAGREWR
ncbi:MAG: hypothetical protein ABR509_01490, partial [Candidatus Limnocylindria bacterium]